MINFFDINLYIVLMFGLLIGSFLNVILYRLPRGLNFTTERSVCTNCGNQIKAYDLIPVLSYCFLGGKCRYCKEKISIQYPLVEIMTAILFSGTYIVSKTAGLKLLALIFLLFIVSLVIVGIFTDFLYLGCYDFSTYIVCVLYLIFSFLITLDIKNTIQIVISGVTFLIPMFLMALYAYAGSTGKILYKLLVFFIMLFVAVIASTFVAFNVEPIFYILNGTFNWLALCIPLILADLIINKLKIKEKIKNNITKAINWFNFITYFMFLFVLNNELFTLDMYKRVFSLNFKNVIILIIGTMFYLFFIELFNGYDNDVDAIEADEEIEEKEENKFSNYIGDGDFLIMPLAGMLLGYSNILSFFCILAINVLATYAVSFRKGIKYHIPMYPFIILSIVVLYFMSF